MSAPPSFPASRAALRVALAEPPQQRVGARALGGLALQPLLVLARRVGEARRVGRAVAREDVADGLDLGAPAPHGGEEGDERAARRHYEAALALRPLEHGLRLRLAIAL